MSSDIPGYESADDYRRRMAAEADKERAEDLARHVERQNESLDLLSRAVAVLTGRAKKSETIAIEVPKRGLLGKGRVVAAWPIGTYFYDPGNGNGSSGGIASVCLGADGALYEGYPAKRGDVSVITLRYAPRLADLGDIRRAVARGPVKSGLNTGMSSVLADPDSISAALKSLLGTDW